MATPCGAFLRRIGIKGLLLPWLMGVGSISFLLGALWQASRFPPIPWGLRIGPVEVGGMSAEEARRRLEEALEECLRTPWVLTAEGRRWEGRPAEWGVRFDGEAALQRALALGQEGSFGHRLRTRWRLYRQGLTLPLPVRCPQEPFTAWLRRVAKEVNREPQDAQVVVEGEGVRIVPHRPGLRLNLEEARRRVEEALRKGEPHAIPLPLEEVAPRIRTEDVARVEVPLSRFTTYFNPAARARSHNLALAVQRINGVLLRPGEVFSYNETVGRRTMGNGFRVAPIFLGRRVVPGVGGGVCQVATTLYNAALLAGLEIVERHRHSRPVDYVAPGRDATVDYGSLDLKFRANTRYPVYITAQVVGNRLTVCLWGAREDRREVRVVAVRDAALSCPVVEVPDPSLAPGQKVVEDKGTAGYRTRTFRILLQNGQEVRRELVSQDVYPAAARRVRVGVAPGVDAEEKGTTPPADAPSPAEENL